MKWIPVSQRLPKKDGFYLVTVDLPDKQGRKVIEDRWVAKEAFWAKSRWHQFTVKAWVEWPKPYEGML